ncbi:MAG: fused MFS/spermidine synthase [FCB group bacterium]|nr:fused MFS/spermidine synthase [FCB group bacterium]
MTLFAKENIIFERESLYHHIVVSEEAGVRYMKFGNNIVQSAVYIDDPLNLRLDYTKYLPLAILFKSDFKTLLTIGLGGGAVPRILKEYYPETYIDAVEIDPLVVETAKKYFFVGNDPDFNIHVTDGRVFLNKTDRKYDLIILDAYNSDSIPFHLTTEEFLRLVKSKLAVDGAVSTNVWSTNNKLYLSMVKTYEKVFDNVYRFRVWGKTNVVIVASDKRLSSYEIIQRAANIQAAVNFPFDLPFCATQLDLSELEFEDVPVLTDDYAPVDYLQHTGN